MSCHAGPRGEEPDSVGRQKKVKGKCGHSLFRGFYGKGKAGQGKDLGSASLSNSSRLWDIGTVPKLSSTWVDLGQRNIGFVSKS